MPLEKYTYLILMAFCLIFPLAFSFDKRVAFYKNWGKLFVATIVPAAFFIAWDVWFTSRSIWSFNDSYVVGIKIFNLPIEEILFFIVIPYCSIFVFEVLKSYFPKADYNQQLFWGLIFLCLIFIGSAVYFFNHVYTFWNFTFNAVFLAILLLNMWFLEHITHFLLTFAICLVPMLIVNGVLTALPVVEYNPLQISGFKIYTIPFEDFFYFFLLLMMNVLIFVRMKRVRE
ncbi:MAG: lycopene cyclase domain-containing protein [Paludibacter sp.]